jgi:hypothetical protein
MEFFCNLIRGKAMHLPPILDVEIAGPGLRNLVREALDLIHQETGWIPMVYTRGGILAGERRPGLLGEEPSPDRGPLYETLSPLGGQPQNPAATGLG